MERPREFACGGCAGAWMLMEGGVLSGEQRGRNGVEGAGAGLAAEAGRGSKALWYAVWGAMGAVACASALVAANGSPSAASIEGTYGLLLSVLLAAVATVQLVRGMSFLLGKETALAAVVLVLFGFAQLGHYLIPGPSAGAGVDFATYYTVGHEAAQRRFGEMYHLPLYPDGRIDLRTFPFIYPPLFAVLMRPFTFLPVRNAYFLWNCLDLMLIVASCWMALGLGDKKLSCRLALILSVGVLSFYPLIHELHLGQVGGWILFLWTGSSWLLARNRIWFSALCFAAATMIKLTPVIAIPLFVFHRRWKWLAAYCCWMLVLLGFSVWQVGWAAQKEFVGKVLPSISCGAPVFQNASLFGFVQELLLGRVFRAEEQPLTIAPVVCMVSKAVALVTYAIVMVRFYLGRREQGVVRQLMLAMLLSLVISPISWWQHYVLALAPLIFLWDMMRETDRDWLLTTTALVTGTNVAGFALMLSSNHAIQLLLEGVVPCLTLGLVYFRIPGEELVGGNSKGA